MPTIYLSPASISYLTEFLLALVITIYLAGFHMRRGNPDARRQGLTLFLFFTTLTILAFLFFLENVLLPADRLAPTWLESPVLSLLIILLIIFAYNFPAPNPSQRTERWLIYILSGRNFYWEFSFAIHRILLMRTGVVQYRPSTMDYERMAEFAWIIFIFARSCIKNWKIPAVRNFALILFIPLGLAFLEVSRNVNATTTFLFPICMAIGLLVTTFLFALNYLTSQPDRISFVVKISGVLLTSVLAVFGTIAWLVTPAYAAQYQALAQTLDHRSLHFSPDGSDGFQVSEIPFHWEENSGERVSIAYDISKEYEFTFPFLGQTYQKIAISSDGAIGVGGRFSGTTYQVHFNPSPMIFPMLIRLNGENPQEGGVYVQRDPGRILITWDKLRSYFHGQVYTFQAVLFSDGSFNFTYDGLPDIQYVVDEQADESVWVVGIKPASAPPGTSDFTHLPMQIGPDGALQDEFQAFRIYIDRFLRPLAIAILGSSLAFLVGMMALLNLNLARPLNTLLMGVQGFNKGEREKSIPIQSNDEIGYLTESFNRLVDELNDLIHGLEKRVAERTQELSRVNGQLRSEMEARTKAQEQVVENQRALATLEERERLARELHDGIGQVLGFLNVQAQSANDCLHAGDQQAASHLLCRMAEVAQEAHDDVRGYILGLKKDIPAQSGLDFYSRVEDYRQHLWQCYGFQTVLNRPERSSTPLAQSAVEAQLLLIIREALANACAHSGEKQAEVTILVDEILIWAIIEDHGQGFTEYKKDGHFGLEIMRQRTEAVGGSLDVDSTAGVGTRVTVCLPRQIEDGKVAGLRVLLVDDHPLFLEGLANLVAGRGMQVVGTACDGLEAQEKARVFRPDVILMDIDMPRCDGIEATRRIKAEMPEAKVVMLTVSGEEHHLFQALQYGASGYLLKSLVASELTALLEELLRGEVSMSPSLARKMLEAFTRHNAPQSQPPNVLPETECNGAEATAQAELTTRQGEILQLVAQGYQYKEIALQLGLAEVTIKYHMGEILARLHVNNRREAVQYFQSGKLHK